MSPHIHFVTGRLAERALREVLQDLAPKAGFGFSIDVLPITVAALMTPKWIARHIQTPPMADKVLVPGYCAGDLSEIAERAGADVERGPKDLRQLPEYFGGGQSCDDYGDYDIEILAEINHAPRLTLKEILRQAKQLADDGADVIDVGCDPGGCWNGAGDCVRALRDQGHRVSIDSFDRQEVEAAVAAGAELVLSVNSSNLEAAVDWGCPVVAIPDRREDLAGLEETIERLSSAGVAFRVDPILEPIGCGFGKSLSRYIETRRRYPQCEMMMGIGNLTELTDVDSAGVNVMLLGVCQELGIRSVLTTQVINWARSCVKECDVARRLTYYAVNRGVPPKNLDRRLVMLRDARLYSHGEERLDELSRQIRDHNYRLFAEEGRLHLLSAGQHLTDANPFALFHQLLAQQPKNLDPTHAFYLGYEMAKAATAVALGKQYQQDEALDWGLLTQPESSLRKPACGPSDDVQ